MVKTIKNIVSHIWSWFRLFYLTVNWFNLRLSNPMECRRLLAHCVKYRLLSRWCLDLTIRCLFNFILSHSRNIWFSQQNHASHNFTNIVTTPSPRCLRIKYNNILFFLNLNLHILWYTFINNKLVSCFYGLRANRECNLKSWLSFSSRSLSSFRQ